MINTEIIDIVIGLMFIFSILSLLGSTMIELMAGILHLRGKNLRKSLSYMLADPGNTKLFDAFVEHPLFRKLKRNTAKKLPSYLSSKKFSEILIEIINADVKQGAGKMEESIMKIEGNTGKVLLSLWQEAAQNMDAFKNKLEEWFEEVQVRATGWYKRNTQVLLLVLGFVIAVAINADTIGIVEKLYKDSAARRDMNELVREQAHILESPTTTSIDFTYVSYDEYVNETPESDEFKFTESQFEDLLALYENINGLLENQLSDVNHIMDLGWDSFLRDFDKAKSAHKEVIFFLYKLLGFLLTAIAVSLGASFWFDRLKTVIKNTRGLPVILQKDAK